MAFWSGETIKAHRSIVTDFDDSRVDCNSYKLRMGNVYFKTSDVKGQTNTKKILSDGESFAVPPGQFGFLLSKEKVHLPPDTMGFLSMRNGFKFKGLINVSGFNVDPGYNGKLLFAVYNAGALPVNISENEPIFKIWFADIDLNTTRMFFTQKGIYDIDNSLVDGASREILSLQVLSDRIDEVEKDVSKSLAEQKPVFDDLRFVYRALIIGVIIAAVGSFIKSSGSPNPNITSSPPPVASSTSTSAPAH